MGEFVNAVVSALAIYPVKSLGGFAVDSLPLEQRGPVGDRRWMLVDAGGRFLSQREYASLCRVTTALWEGRISVSAPGREQLTLDETLVADAPVRPVQVWSDQVEALDAGDQAAAWFSDYLGINCRLVYMPESTQRPVNPQYAPAGSIVSFADGFPLHLISTASLEDFNSHLSRPVGVQRFRPNIVIDGAAAWAEDGWRRLRIGGVECEVAKACARCVVPSIDLDTAQLEPEVTKTLFQQRRRKDNQFYFGINLVHRGEGVLRIGDKVEVLE